MMSRRTGCVPVRAARLRAFTLTELAVVLAITAIMMAIAQPRLAQVMVRDRLRRAGTKLKTDIRALQSEAVRARNKTGLGFDANNEFYVLWEYNPSSSKWRILDRLEPKVNACTSLGMNRDYKTAIHEPSGVGSLTFDAYGLPAADETVTLGIGLLRIDVEIEAASGKVTVGDLYEVVTATPNVVTVWPTRSDMKTTAPGTAE